MDGLKYRKSARVVAYLDLILTSMSLLVVIVLAIIAGGATVVLAKGAAKIDGEVSLTEKQAKQLSAFTIGLWVGVVISAILTFVELWAAIKLMNATDIGQDYDEAHRKCSTWRTVCIIFLCLSILGGILIANYISIAIDLLFRGAFLVVVCQFMTELKSLSTNQPMPMRGVTVMKQ